MARDGPRWPEMAGDGLMRSPEKPRLPPGEAASGRRRRLLPFYAWQHGANVSLTHAPRQIPTRTLHTHTHTHTHTHMHSHAPHQAPSTKHQAPSTKHLVLHFQARVCFPCRVQVRPAEAMTTARSVQRRWHVCRRSADTN